MNIDDLTIKQAKELTLILGGGKKSDKSHPFEIGKNYFIRTVTMSHVGNLKEIHDDTLVLSGASWVADSGRLSDAMKSGLESLSASELEPFVNDLIIGRGAIIDMTVYNFPLPTKQK